MFRPDDEVRSVIDPAITSRWKSVSYSLIISSTSRRDLGERNACMYVACTLAWFSWEENTDGSIKCQSTLISEIESERECFGHSWSRGECDSRESWEMKNPIPESICTRHSRSAGDMEGYIGCIFWAKREARYDTRAGSDIGSEIEARIGHRVLDDYFTRSLYHDCLRERCRLHAIYEDIDSIIESCSLGVYERIGRLWKCEGAVSSGYEESPAGWSVETLIESIDVSYDWVQISLACEYETGNGWFYGQSFGNYLSIGRLRKRESCVDRSPW